MYVPSLYRADYNEDGTLRSFEPIEEGVPRTVVKNMVADLDKAEYPESVIVPFMEIVHDRINIEVLRGCTRGCRFCQAGMIYRPVRERSMARLMELADKLVAETGYEEITLSSLSTGDYSCLPQLAHALMERFAQQRVALSLPSLRLDSNLKETLEETQKVRKSSLTYAMEAGTQRLRDVINKGITEENLVESLTDAFAGGWSSVKLYFMFGLPTETYEDLDGIADLASKVVRLYFKTPRHLRAKGLRVHCSASCFVPKPFTPFQWEPQDTIEQFEEKQRHLCRIMRIKGVAFNWHEPQVSFLEAVFARGDRRTADALEEASFALEQDQVSGIVEQDGVYYILKCVNAYDQEATAARKEQMEEDRKKQVFQSIYEPFTMEHQVVYSEGLWEAVSFAGGEDCRTDNFFSMYRKYFGRGN